MPKPRTIDQPTEPDRSPDPDRRWFTSPPDVTIPIRRTDDLRPGDSSRWTRVG